MKKVIVLAMVMFASTSIFAITNEDYKVFQKLNNQSTVNSLVRYLDADFSQSIDLKYVFSLTEEKLQSALNSGSEAKVERAIGFNLVNVKAILSEEQYKKYLYILNVSLNHSKVDLLAEVL